MIGLLLLFTLLFVFLFRVFQQGKFFLAHSETVVCVQVEEHDIDIRFSTPASVTAESCAVTFPNHGFSIQYPFGIAVTVSTFGQIMNFSVTRCVDQCNILVIPSANTYVVGKNPFAVRTPLIPLVAVTIRIFVLAVHDGAYSF